MVWVCSIFFMVDMKKWAENEVELAIKDIDEEDMDRMKVIYNSALKAYESLIDDRHSGLTFSIVKSILMDLLDERPLSPIEESDDLWEEVEENWYQCKRAPYLFKVIDEKGNMTYTDLKRVEGVTTENGTNYVHYNSFTRKMIDDLYPITFPYLPLKKPYEVRYIEFIYQDVHYISFGRLTTPEGKHEQLYGYFKLVDDKLEEMDPEEWLLLYGEWAEEKEGEKEDGD